MIEALEEFKARYNVPLCSDVSTQIICITDITDITVAFVRP